MLTKLIKDPQEDTLGSMSHFKSQSRNTDCTQRVILRDGANSMPSVQQTKVQGPAGRALCTSTMLVHHSRESPPIQQEPFQITSVGINV